MVEKKNDSKESKVVFKCLIRRQQKKTCANNIKLEAVDFLCVYVNFTHRNQDSDYNDSAAVCIFLKELSQEMLKTTKINSKVPKKTPQFTFKPITLDIHHL